VARLGCSRRLTSTHSSALARRPHRQGRSLLCTSKVVVLLHDPLGTPAEIFLECVSACCSRFAPQELAEAPSRDTAAPPSRKLGGGCLLSRARPVLGGGVPLVADPHALNSVSVNVTRSSARLSPLAGTVATSRLTPACLGREGTYGPPWAFGCGPRSSGCRASQASSRRRFSRSTCDHDTPASSNHASRSRRH